jgi:hypothetical protein
MKNPLKFAILSLALFVVSCDEPVTVVTNYIHADGTVTRKIEMRDVRKGFDREGLQVPFDSTWTVADSIEVNDKGDTTWVKRAEKTFSSIDEINNAYSNDSGANRRLLRSVSMKKNFRWFNTGYRFSERIEKIMQAGLPLSDFMNEEELKFFYSPDGLRTELQNGPDSTRYRSLNDSVSVKSEMWSSLSVFNEFIHEFSRITKDQASGSAIKKLEARKEGLHEWISAIQDFDSLWDAGIILEELIGKEDAVMFRDEADSALNISIERFLVDFKEYSVRAAMPGKLTNTNGFADSSKLLLWPVKSDFFVSEPYEMWAESKVPNIWAWVVSGIFVLFVAVGLVIRAVRKP